MKKYLRAQLLSLPLPLLRRQLILLRVLTPRPRRRRSPSCTTGAVSTSAQRRLGYSRRCWDLVDAAGVFIAAEGCHEADGGTVGGQIGYRWQAGTWVFGLEGQGNWADFQGSNASLFFPESGTNRASMRSA